MTDAAIIGIITGIGVIVTGVPQIILSLAAWKRSITNHTEAQKEFTDLKASIAINDIKTDGITKTVDRTEHKANEVAQTSRETYHQTNSMNEDLRRQLQSANDRVAKLEGQLSAVAKDTTVLVTRNRSNRKSDPPTSNGEKTNGDKHNGK